MKSCAAIRTCVLSVALIATILQAGCNNGPLGEWGAEPARPMIGDPQKAYAAARDRVYRATTSPNGEARSWAMETLALTQRAAAGDILIRGLDDKALAVRFAAAMGIGDCRVQAARPKLQALIEAPNTPQPLQCAVIYALHRLGRNQHVTRLASMLVHGKPETRANAALVMAKMGNRAAVGPLRAQWEDERHPGVRLQLVEALASLKDRQSIGHLTAYLKGGEAHEQMQAVQALGRTRDPGVKRVVLEAYDRDRPPPLRIAAVAALARMGDYRGRGLALKAVKDPTALAGSVRLTKAQVLQYKMLGALALGQMNSTGPVDTLVEMLDEPDELGAVAAAKSILILLTRHAVAENAAPAPASAPAAAPTGSILRTAPPRD